MIANMTTTTVRIRKPNTNDRKWYVAKPVHWHKVSPTELKNVGPTMKPMKCIYIARVLCTTYTHILTLQSLSHTHSLNSRFPSSSHIEQDTPKKYQNTNR